MPASVGRMERSRTGAATGRNDVLAWVAGGFPRGPGEDEPVLAMRNERSADGERPDAIVHVAHSRNP